MYHLFRTASELTAVKSEFSLSLQPLVTINIKLFYAAPLLCAIINNISYVTSIA